MSVSNTIGFAVAHRVEYGRRLETLKDGQYGVCKKAVQHFSSDLDEWIRTKWRVSDPDYEDTLKNKCRRLAVEAQYWAQNNHGWKNKTGDAERLLKGFLVIDGKYT